MVLRQLATPAIARSPSRIYTSQFTHKRPFFSIFKSKSAPPASPQPPLLAQDNLFHPLSHSPFSALREKADRIKSVSLCPTSFEKHHERVRPAFDCPGCGWPTHKNQERWEEGKEEHNEYCGRLKEVNEDEHDLRSGRRMTEFENMPEEQPYESAVNFASWDTLFFTRGFLSIDSDRSVRHVSKILTYPMTIAGVLHQNGPFTSGNGRVTRQGRRSMAALHSILHLPPGATVETASDKPQTPFRLFLLGARAESTLPPHLWAQLTHLFPRVDFEIYFIGPEVGLPLINPTDRLKKEYAFSQDNGWGVPSYIYNHSPQLSLISLQAPYEQIHDQFGPFDPYTDVFFAFSPGFGFPHQPLLEKITKGGKGQVLFEQEEDGKKANARTEADAYSPAEIESDVPYAPPETLVQAQTTWRRPLQQILETKCPFFFTAFSPLDLQRDVSALFGTNPPSANSPGSPVREFPDYVALPTGPIEPIEGVTDEFELVLTPGVNPFGSLKWEIAEWDVRVGVKTNWGTWGIRGKKYDVVEGH
nr:mitochondrial splicing suppressor [Cryptococcus depauperatus CBS 7841]